MNSRQNPPENRAFSNTTTAESSGKRRGKIRRFLAKVTKKISDSRSSDPVLPNADSEGASSIPDIKVQDAPSGPEQGYPPHLSPRMLPRLHHVLTISSSCPTLLITTTAPSVGSSKNNQILCRLSAV